MVVDAVPTQEDAYFSAYQLESGLSLLASHRTPRFRSFLYSSREPGPHGTLLHLVLFSPRARIRALSGDLTSEMGTFGTKTGQNRVK